MQAKLDKKRPRPLEGANVDKRQRLLGDVAHKTKQSLPESSAGETKEDGTVARKRYYCRSPPCIAIIYEKIGRKYVKGNYINTRYVQSGDPIPFTSRLKASESELFGGMLRVTIGNNIDTKAKSKIKGGIHINKYVMFSNIPVEPIILEGIEIPTAPKLRSGRVIGEKYVVNGIVRIWGGWYLGWHGSSVNN